MSIIRIMIIYIYIYIFIDMPYAYHEPWFTLLYLYLGPLFFSDSPEAPAVASGHRDVAGAVLCQFCHPNVSCEASAPRT